MNVIMDASRAPQIDEIREFIGNDLFDRFYQSMLEEYGALIKIEFSRDVWMPGWNVKMRKAGKSLCVIYPKQGYFTVLVVIGKKEKERAEALLPELSEEMQAIYEQTREGCGQRWLMIDLTADGPVYRDVFKLIRIRWESKSS